MSLPQQSCKMWTRPVQVARYKVGDKQKQRSLVDKAFYGNALAQSGRALSETLRDQGFNSLMCCRLQNEVKLNYYLEL